MNREQQMATVLLQNRSQGVSMRRLIRRSGVGYLLTALIAVIFLSLFLCQDDVPIKFICLTGFGLYSGALLRDIQWFNRIKKDWLFISRVLDWPRIEAIAEGKETANQAKQADGADAPPA